ncbi:MAG: outer membrane protein assembly factor BamD [Flavobacteriaceae bacterium]|nr:outer membrane protein assembly factor BamD [Flavobacteriaceae bacterium]
MKQLSILFTIAIILSSCGEYQKAIKSDDVKVKFDMGTALYEEGKYAKAQRLFALIVPNYRGKPQAEKLMYMYSDTFYQTEDYYLAAFQFDRFVKAYPKSDRLDDASFKSAKSSYHLSPRFSLDQNDTEKAITKMQEFINSYPNSDKIVEANAVIQELEDKLEKKQFEIAKQFHKISDFKTAIKSLDNFVEDHPGSKRKEEALYLKFDSAYKLAMLSVESKKAERLQNAKNYYNKFKADYGSSEFLEQASESFEDIEKEQKETNTEEKSNS